MSERPKDPNKGLVCLFSDCKASFSKSWKLEAHYCKHTGLKPFVCDSCAKSFSTRYKLTRHQLSHSGQRLYQCSVDACAETFSTSSSLKNHVARVHQHKKKTYVCNYEDCGKEFHKNKQLKAHECEHTNILPYECQFEGCGKKYAASQTLKRHEKVHNGYPCAEEGCPFKGKTWTEYQAHRKAEHREIFQCGDCKRVFHEAWFLQKHKWFVHSGERRVFKCTQEGCQKTYTKRIYLQNHILFCREGKRPFICTHSRCGKAFALEKSLKRHAAFHERYKNKMQKLQLKPGVQDASELSGQLQNISINKSE